MSTNFLDHYLALGWRITPVERNAKRPLLENWQGRPALSADELRTFEQCNFGVITGEVSGNLVDIDLDDHFALKLAPLFLPQTGCRFGRRSKPNSHWLYRAENGTGPYKAFSLPGGPVEYRSDRHQTVVPPSVHGGEEVRFDEMGEPSKVDSTALMLATKKLSAAALMAHHWKRGQRHRTSVALAGYLAWIGWSESEGEHFVRAICWACGDEEESDRLDAVRTTWRRSSLGQTLAGSPELLTLIGSEPVALLRSWLESNGRPLEARSSGRDASPLPYQELYEETDNYRAESFAAWAKERLIYLADSNKWLRWDNNSWEDCGQAGAIALASQFAKGLIADLANNPLNTRKFAAAKQANSKKGIDAIVKLSEPHLAKLSTELDSDPYAFGCANGWIDLRSGKLNPPDPSKLITRASQVGYVPDAQCPKFNAFLDRLFGADEGMMAYLQRLAGYCLTGATKERVFFIAYGPTKGGKSTFFTTLGRIVGDYGMYAQVSHLNRQSADPTAQSEHLARLNGARLVTAAEAARAQNVDEGLIKQMTGGEPITARFMHGHLFQFQPQFKLVIYTNFRPKLSGDKALFNRVHSIPFDVQIPESERINGFGDMLVSSEAEGILAWAVRGCLAWQREGLNPPKKVLDANAQYQSEADEVQSYLDARVSCGRNALEGKGATLADYEQWAADDGREPMKKSLFYDELKARFPEAKYRPAGGKQVRAWKGFHLKRDGEEPKPTVMPSSFEALGNAELPVNESI